MVPGAPGGWAELNRRFGTRPLAELFAPAIAAAREGVPVQVNVEPQWAKDSKRIAAAMEQDSAPHAYWWQTFMKEDGSPYRAGDIFRWPEYADTLEELAATNCESYYRGKLMEQIVAFSQKTGGYFREEDFRTYHPVGGAHPHGLQGLYRLARSRPTDTAITVLMALNILEGLNLLGRRSRGRPTIISWSL